MAEYIEREAAMNLCGWYNTTNGKSICAARKDELAALPSADVVERKRGEWTAVSYWKYQNGHSTLYTAKRCSVCGADARKKSKHNFCPNCGARMVNDNGT